MKISPNRIRSGLGVAQRVRLASSEQEPGGLKWIRHAKSIGRNRHRWGRNIGWNLSARLVVPPGCKRIRTEVKSRDTSYIRVHLRDMRTAKWKWSVRRCSSTKSNASVMANIWDGIQKLWSEVRHTIGKWTRIHRDGLNIVTRRMTKTPKRIRSKRRSINYRSGHSTSICLWHCNCGGYRSRKGAINYIGYGSRRTPRVLETRFSAHPCGTTSLKSGCVCTTPNNSMPFRRQELEIWW